MKLLQTGILLIDKPEGITSSKVVQSIKRNLKLEKVGHAGTLDPFATGLLVVMCGKATRLSDPIMKGSKTYTGIMRLGISTNTDDITGDVISKSEHIPSLEEIKSFVEKRLMGAISQIPPQVSAKKIEGVAAYKHARKGIEVALKPCDVFVSKFSVEATEKTSDFIFEVRCSAGTYIRALARDIGAHFECGGCLVSLRRTESGVFSVARACSLEEVSPNMIASWDLAFPDTPRFSIAPEIIQKLQSGDERVLPEIRALLSPLPDEEVVLIEEHSHIPSAVMSRKDGEWNRSFVA